MLRLTISPQPYRITSQQMSGECSRRWVLSSSFFWACWALFSGHTSAEGHEVARKPWPHFGAEELLVMAKTIYGEARGEDREGQRAVGHVILNRFKLRPKYGADLAGVCLKKDAFEAWSEDNPNLGRMRNVGLSNSHVLRVCMISALEALSEYDFTQGSTYYHAKDIEQVPKWAFGHAPIYSHGNHLFYNDIR